MIEKIDRLFFQNSLKNINVGTNPIQKHIFFKKIFIKIFRNQPTKFTSRKTFLEVNFVGQLRKILQIIFLKKICFYDGFGPTFMILREILKKKFFQNFFNFLVIWGGISKNFRRFGKNFFFPKFPQNHKCRHKTIIETYFFQKFYK